MAKDDATLLMVANVRRLLQSEQLAQVKTGVEMIHAGGLPTTLYNNLMFAYLIAENQDLRSDIRDVLYASSLSERTKRYIKKILIHPWVI